MMGTTEGTVQRPQGRGRPEELSSLPNSARPHLCDDRLRPFIRGVRIAPQGSTNNLASERTFRRRATRQRDCKPVEDQPAVGPFFIALPQKRTGIITKKDRHNYVKTTKDPAKTQGLWRFGQVVGLGVEALTAS